ncbi:MAG: TdeIII family type II restriction endonuclease [Nitrospinae bacterium]|nr:TdeIII family type II restriction endonuclease [Nitrospinota bacterium]
MNTLVAIPYNPYEPQPYERWTLKGMLDLDNELKVAEEFWDFLGGKGAYNELLDCFENAGIELRPEIDEYFAKFNK